MLSKEFVDNQCVRASDFDLKSGVNLKCSLRLAIIDPSDSSLLQLFENVRRFKLSTEVI